MHTLSELPVPAVAAEEHLWAPAVESRGLYSRSELRRQSGTYYSALPARISGWAPRIDGELGADVEDATRALVSFDQFAARTLGLHAPELGPMSAILLRTESSSSSQIENLTASARQLALAELRITEAPNSRTVVGNVRAMEAAIELANDLSKDAILTMHRELLRHQPGMERHASVLRDELVWIGKGAAGPLLADFVAPQAEHLDSLIDDLVAFLERADLPALIQIAVAHAQFETIHPFVDGNGRTGRALVQALLRGTGVTTATTAPLSAGLLRDTDGYFDALTAYRQGDAGPIVRSFASAARFAALSGEHLVQRLDAVIAESRARLEGVRSHSAAFKLLPLLIAQPVITAAYVQRMLGTNATTANRALALLTEREVLVERSGKSRGRSWQHSGVLDALDEYAEAIRRPRS